MEVKKKKWGEEIINNVCSSFSICASWEASLNFSFILHLLDGRRRRLTSTLYIVLSDEIRSIETVAEQQGRINEFAQFRRKINHLKWTSISNWKFNTCWLLKSRAFSLNYLCVLHERVNRLLRIQQARKPDQKPQNVFEKSLKWKVKSFSRVFLLRDDAANSEHISC